MTSHSLPVHVAIVMDGNGRWASKRFLPRLAGHHQGVESLKRCAKACDARGIRVLTVFAFSSENWSRPAEEVSGLMDLFAMALGREVSQMHQEGVRMHFVGDRSKLSDRVLREMEQATALTCNNTGLILNICFNYGGRWDIVQAVQSLIAKNLPATEKNLCAMMSLAHVPDPDLVIRTGGEQRISNFLLWQSAYAEFVFSEQLWPDFNEQELDKALQIFAKRQRRFGKISPQLNADGSLPLSS